jgi:hypothetical protein
MSHTIKQTRGLKDAVRGALGGDAPVILLPGGFRRDEVASEPSPEQQAFLAQLAQIEASVAQNVAALERIRGNFAALPERLEATLANHDRLFRDADDDQLYVRLEDVLTFLRGYRL